MKKIFWTLLICCFVTNLSAQRENKLKKYYFTINGGFFAGDAFGYTFGASAGLRFSEILSASINFQKTISDEQLVRNQKYDRFNALMFTLKGYIDISETGRRRIYGALGAGYSSTPHTVGTNRENNTGWHFGYYDSYFINPAAGIEFPTKGILCYFLELNYNFHQWTRLDQSPVPGSHPRKNAQVFYLSIGLKL